MNLGLGQVSQLRYKRGVTICNGSRVSSMGRQHHFTSGCFQPMTASRQPVCNPLRSLCANFGHSHEILNFLANLFLADRLIHQRVTICDIVHCHAHLPRFYSCHHALAERCLRCNGGCLRCTGTHNKPDCTFRASQPRA